MSGPITNYELGKRLHREHEAQARHYWAQNLAGDQEPILTEGRKLALVLSGAIVIVFLMVGVMIF